MQKKIVSKWFGTIKLTDEDGFYGDVRDINTGLVIHLDIFEEIKKEEHLLLISEFLDSYQSLNKKAKNYIRHALETEESTAKFYYDFHKTSLSAELSELLQYEEPSNANLVKYTNLSSVWFALEGEQLIATFDYGLLAAVSDEILAIRFNQDITIISISHES